MDYELMMNGNVKIGQKAPDFTADTTFGTVNLENYKGKWVVLFSHPGDFTPVKSESLDEYTKFEFICKSSSRNRSKTRNSL